MITVRKQLDFVPGGEPLRIRVNEGDDDIAVILDLVVSEGELEVEDDTTARIVGLLSTGEAVDMEVTLDGETVSLDPDWLKSLPPGRHGFNLELDNGGVCARSDPFWVCVEMSAATAMHLYGRKPDFN